MNMNEYVTELSRGSYTLEEVGGKAVNLAHMIQDGFNIPSAYVVKVDAYNTFIRESLGGEISAQLLEIDFNDENSLSRGCKNIRDTIKRVKLPDNFFSDIDMPKGYYAVRSSAVSEDLPDASFAGQLDSYLNIKRNDILEKVVECWASYWTDRAVKYRHDSSIGHLDSEHGAAGIAVVVQRMVDAETSGVMFTTNPVDGSHNVVIESTWGLGEAIVSGTVTPDTYVLNREGKVLEKDIKSKEKGYFLKDGKNTLLDIDEDEREKESLTSSDLEKLLKVAIALEKHFQTPQDIEWAVELSSENEAEIYILQSRPVTTLQEKDDILWTRAYGDEYWADATTPLFFDVMGKMLTDYVNHEGARIMGYSDITDTKLLKLYKSRVYFNSWVLEKAFSYYPKFARSKELLNYFPLEDQERISQYPSILHKTLLSQLLIAIRDPDGMMNKTDKAYRRWSARFMEKCQDFDQRDLTKITDEELLRFYEDIEKSGIKHYQLIRYGMVSHSIATNLMIKNWLLKWLNDQDGSLYAGLISGLDDNKTVEMNIRFSDLAKIIREEKGEFEKIISETPRFWREFNLFLDDYGHRSNTREILYPRWREDPHYVLEVVKALSKSDLDLRAKEADSRRHRHETEQEVYRRIKKTRWGFIKSRIFKVVLGLAQTYLTFRENQRFYLDHLLFRQRLMHREMGRRLTKQGLIDEVDDVFFLQEKELFNLFPLNKKEDIRESIIKKKKEFYRYRSVLPPKFLKNGIEFDDTILEYHQNAIYGAAASPGIYTGTARVVEDIKDLSQLEDDEILITSNTDPAWTAVFSKIGGLITETGGILSHGAVISREYRIPAVTAVKGATTLFKTGEELVVDGNEGVVYKK
jgi:pyruvate,water dikinase